MSKSKSLSSYKQNRGHERAVEKLQSLAIPRNALFITGVSALVCLFFWQYLFSNDRLFGGDFDYYAQLYEAFRISLLDFHQLPFWNPWMSGGIPLLANPQLGPLSIQTLLTLLVGSVYGLKLAYVLYALVGFWGMYLLSRQTFHASQLRSTLIAFLWVSNGFFAGHSISHFTFAAFFLLPWLFYTLANWRNRRAWLYLAALEIIIVFSSFHYPLLIMNFAMLVFVATIGTLRLLNHQLNRKDVRRFLVFVGKATALTLLIAGYRLYLIFDYTHTNPRPEALFYETPPGIATIFQALFLPVGTLLEIPKNLQWAWGEYSVYLGLGSTIALVVIGVTAFRSRKNKHGFQRISNWHVGYNAGFIGLALLGLLFALGDFSTFAPYHLLREFPAFSETRVASRWLFIVMFSILALFALWKTNSRLINILLLIAALELFITSGPPRITGSSAVDLPSVQFSPIYQTYDNSFNHSNFTKMPLNSYYYSTKGNVGQVYSDDSIVNTLNKVIGTSKCGQNITPTCDLVLSDNATVIFWSPNKITLHRTAPGDIVLNMNVDRGWRINGSYPFASNGLLDPTIQFVIGDDNTKVYHIKYAPKLSPSWLVWRIHQ